MSDKYIWEIPEEDKLAHDANVNTEKIAPANEPIYYEGLKPRNDQWAESIYGESNEVLMKPIGTFATPEDYLRNYMAINYKEQPGASDYQSFWEDPVKLARYKIAMDNLPPGMETPFWYNKAAVDKAWAYMSASNPGKYWEEWTPLDPSHPIRSELREIGTPPLESIPDRDWGSLTPQEIWTSYSDGTNSGLTGAMSYLIQQGLGGSPLSSEAVNTALASYEPGQLDTNLTGVNGLDEAVYQSLPPWKKMLVWMGSSGAAGSAAQAGGIGAAMGLLTNGLGGLVAGGALGAGLGAGASATQTSMPWLAQALNVLDLPAEGLERIAGMITQIAGAAIEDAGEMYIRMNKWGEDRAYARSEVQKQEDSLTSILNDLPSAWKASAITYETGGVSLTGGKIDTLEQAESIQLDPDQFGLSALKEARSMISNGASLEDVRAEFANRYGVTGQMYDLAGHVLADPLNLIPAAGLKIGAKIAQKTGNKVLGLAFKVASTQKGWRESDGVIRTLTKTYPALLRLHMDDAAKIPGKFGAWSRHIAGIDLDMNGHPVDRWFTPEGQAEVRKKKLFAPTPEARAEESASNILMHVGLNINDAVNPTEVTQTLTRMANTDPNVAAMVGDGSWANSAEASAAPVLMRDVAKSLPELQENLWDIHEPDRALFTNLAKASGIDVEDSVALNKFMNDFIKDPDNVLAQVKRALTEAGNNEILAALNDPTNPVKGIDLKKRAEMFVDGRAVMTLDEYKARVTAYFLDGVEKELVKWFDIKPDKWIFRLGNTIKNTQSMLLLGMNPTYYMNNVINNVVTQAFSGVLGFDGRKANDAFWKRLGIDSPRRLSGVGAADVLIKQGASPIAEAKQADGMLGKVDGFARKVNKALPFTNLSQKAEVGSSDVATTVAGKKAWYAIHKAGVGFDKMSKPAEQMLRNMGIEPQFIYAAAENGMNIKEIEANLWDEVSYNFLSQVASPDQQKLLQDVGVYDSLSARLRKAKDARDIDQAFKDTASDMRKHVEAKAAMDTVIETAKWYQGYITEGSQKAYQAFDLALSDYADVFSAHQKKLDDFHAGLEKVPVGRRRMLKEQFFAEADAEFKLARTQRDKRYLGVCQAMMGNGSPQEVTLTDRLITASQLHDNFFASRKRIWQDFFNAYDGDMQSVNDFTDSVKGIIGEERVAELQGQYGDQWMYRGAQEANRVNYRNMNEALDDVQLDIDNLFIEMFEKHYPGGRNAAIAWRAQARYLQQVLVEAEDYFRHGGDGNKLGELGATGGSVKKLVDEILGGQALMDIPNDQRGKYWKQYHQKVKQPLIADQAKASLICETNIADAAVGKKPVVEQPKVEQPKAKPEKIFTVVEEKVEKAAVKKMEVDLKAKAQADEVRQLVQKPDKYIVNIVNKYGDKKVKSIAEITPEMAQKAMDERARVKAEEQAVKAVEPVKVDGEVDKGAEDLRAFGYSEEEIAKTVEARNKGQDVPTNYWSMTLDDFINQDKLTHDPQGYAKQRKQYVEFARIIHKDSVKQALEAGEDVPDEVLKDYPELQPKPRTKAEIENELAHKAASLDAIAQNSHGVYNREAFSQDLVDVFKLPQQQADGVMAILDVMSEYWSKRTGKAPERWWTENIAGLVEGGEGQINQAVDADLWKTPEQGITSANTSINDKKIPALFSIVGDKWQPDTINLDIGGGRFDNQTDYLKSKGVENLVYDPFNRTKEHNDAVSNQVKTSKVDTVTISNVLNVIAEESNQILVLRQAEDAVKDGGIVYIKVYPGDSSGTGKTTKAGFQQNKKTRDYLTLVKKVFPDAEIRNDVIVATKKANSLYQTVNQNYFYNTVLSDAEVEGYALALSRTPNQIVNALGAEQPKERIRLLDALYKIDPNLARKTAMETKGTLWQGAETRIDTPEFEAFYKGSKLVDDNGKPMQLFHGSDADFDTFSYEFMGKNGTSEGYGFYFTNRKGRAEGYGKNVYSVYVNISKPLSLNTKTLTVRQLDKFIRALDPDGQGYLSNWGDVSFEGYEKVLSKAIREELSGSNTDVDIIGSIINAGGGGYEGAYRILKDTLGFDGVISPWKENEIVAIPFLPEQIKSVLNQGTWDKTNPNTLMQQAKGAASWTKDGLALLHALENADVSTAIHESAHAWLRTLPGVADDDVSVLTNWLRTEYKYELPDDWVNGDVNTYRDAHEAFARAFEKYLQEGKAPRPELQSVFDSFKQWLTAIYRKLRGLDDVKLTDEVRTLFDKWLGGEEQPLPDGLDYLPKRPVGVDPTQLRRSAANPNILFQEAEPIGTPEFSRWFGDSKVVDESGKPKMLYHGTPNSGFDTFKEGLNYFTEEPEYAGNYTRGGYSAYAKTGEQSDNGGIYPVYVSMQKPFDTRLPEAQKIFNEEFYGKYGNGAPLDDTRGLPDWTDAEYLYEFIQEKGYDFDGLILAEAHGKITYATFYPEQAKSVFNRGTYDPTNPNILFQEAEPIPPVQSVAGTVDSLAPPPQTSAMIEGMLNEVNPVLNELHMKYLQADADTTRPKGKLADRMREGIKKANPGLSDPEIDNLLAQGTKEVQKYIRQVGHQMKGEKLATMKLGLAGRDFAILNYNQRTNFDTYMGMVFPYQFWYTRSMINWAMRGLDRPAMLANYSRIRKTQSELGREGLPYRLRNKSFIPIPFMPDWMGEGVYFDPLKQTFPFEQFTKPIDNLLKQNNTQMKKAMSILHQWESEGEADSEAVTEALQTQSGDLWKRAMAQADIELEQDIENPFDFVTSMMGTSLPIQYAYQLAMGRPDKISQLPITRFVQAMTGMANIGGPAGINLEAPIRKAVGLPEMDRYYDYRVNRMLANMAAEGTITAEQANQAIVSKSGPVFEQAQGRVAQMGGWQYLGAPLGVDFFPEGEQIDRALQKEYNNAISKWKGGDDTALNTFFDKYPEYETQMLAWKDEGEQLKRFLISEVWDRYSELPAVHKKQVQEQFGDNFTMAFLNSDTRDYDALDTETITMWAQMLNGFVPEDKKQTTLPLKLADDVTAKAVDTYYADRKAKFGEITEEVYQSDAYNQWRNAYLAKHPEILEWVTSEQSELYGLPAEIQQQVYQFRAMRDAYYPNIYETQNEYFDLDKETRKEYLKQHPELASYWDFREQMAGQFPKAATYIMSDQAVSNALTDQTPYAVIQITRKMSGQLYRQFMGYLYGNETLTAGAKKELRRLWEEAGEPEGDLDEWLDQAKNSL